MMIIEPSCLVSILSFEAQHVKVCTRLSKAGCQVSELIKLKSAKV